MSDRSDILLTAENLISGDRAETYGDPVDNFRRIGIIWAAVLGYTSPIPPDMVALMLAGLKMARLSDNLTHEDSWVDLAGYAALGGEVAERIGGPRPGQFVSVPPASVPDEPKKSKKRR